MIIAEVKLSEHINLADLKADIFTEKTARIYVNLEDLIIPHCGVCRARNHMLRLHPAGIHFDAESPDFQDDSAHWNYHHDEERYGKS